MRLQIEQGVPFVALVPVLLAQAQDFPKDFHIEAPSLRADSDQPVSYPQALK